MPGGSGRNTFYCNACSVRFALYARRQPRPGRTFCPGCGESADVEVYDTRKHSKHPGGHRRYWTITEQLELKRLLEKGEIPKAVADRFNRTPSAVYKAAIRFGYIKN